MNVCFIVVFFFSSLLTWRELVVLKDAYIASQRSNLENVAHEMDARLQFNVDRLLFFRNGMQSALQTPLAFEVLRNAQSEFEQKRMRPFWTIKLDPRRTLPVAGVSDSFVADTAVLSRDNALLDNELTAALEMGYLLRLSYNAPRPARQIFYVSRSGFFLSSQSVEDNADIINAYYGLVTSSWFVSQSQRSNPARGLLWHTFTAGAPFHDVQRVTASVPLDYQHIWYGVLAMDFSVHDMKQFLMRAVEGEREGEYQLCDSKMNLIASSEDRRESRSRLSPQEQEQLLAQAENHMRGGIQLMTRYVSWEKLHNFDGILLRIHTLHEGIHGDFGNITVVLGLVWGLFTAMLLISWIVIRRMVINMTSLQASLQWQAWYDTLTRLLNRGALFTRAAKAMAECQRLRQPVSLIQIDIDHFKSINDRFGHQAGDRVLAHVARLIVNRTRETDMTGRVGGEEFCIVLPDTTLAQATDIAERIRQRVCVRELLVKKDTTLRVSISLGVSCSEESGQYHFESLQLVADSRLYFAKQNGRNQVRSED